MNKSKTEISRAVAGIIMLVGVNAVASGHYVKTYNLERILDSQTISELIKREILLPTPTSDRFQFNNNQVIAVLKESQDPETAAFMTWLRTEVEKESEVNLKKTGDMHLSTQDREPRQKAEN
jgi:hypothetical protein